MDKIGKTIVGKVAVVKHGIIGFTKYLAIYGADKGIRVNVLCLGGVIIINLKNLSRNLLV